MNWRLKYSINSIYGIEMPLGDKFVVAIQSILAHKNASNIHISICLLFLSVELPLSIFRLADSQTKYWNRDRIQWTIDQVEWCDHRSQHKRKKIWFSGINIYHATASL